MRVKTNYHLLIAPVITLIITGVFFAVYSIFPFGKNTISWCDMNQQTIPLLMDFKDILDGKSGIFYSTANAGGMNFWGVFLFFLASPLYLTVKFVEKSHFIYLVNILFAVKLMLSAFTASVYFNKIHKRLKPEFSVVFSIMYALCGYGIMYCQTLVWLDIMALFPLLVLSVDRMIKTGKSLMYGIILSLMMCICFYLSYMIIIYLLIAVPLCIAITVKKYERKRVCFSFISASLISALITAPVWLCAFLQISSSARGGSALAEIMYKPMFENTANKLCILMCTAICFAVLTFFIKNKITKNKSVKFNLILLVCLMIPVFTDPINKMWHTGSYQSFPLRYGFVLVFTMLVLCGYYFENVTSFGKTSKEFLIATAVLAVGFVSLSVYIVYSKKEELSSFTEILKVDGQAFKILFMLFLIVYLLYIICILLQRRMLIGSKALCVIFILIFVGEVFTSFSVNIGYAKSEGGVLKTSAPLEYDSTGKPYYRTKTEKKYIHVNMVGGLGYNSLAHYTSLTNEEYMFAMKKLGYSSYWMEVGANGGTVITDALLAIKYSIGAYYDFKSCYDITNLEGDLERGESSIYCPVGIISRLSPDNFSELGDGSRVATQRELAKKYFGTDKMIYEYRPSFTADGSFEYVNNKYTVTVDDRDNSICQMRYSIDVKGRQILYFDVFDRLSNDLSEEYYGSVEIYVNGNHIISNYPTQKNNGIITLGEFENTTAEILILINKDISVKSMGVFGVDTDILKRCTQSVSGCDFYTDENGLSAECTVSEECWLYMSVPFDKSMKADINGTETELLKVNEAFSAVKLNSGKNNLKLVFRPYGMNVALVLTAVGVVLFLIGRIKNKRFCSDKMILNISYAITAISFTTVIVAVYAVPLILKLAAAVSELFV